MFSFSDLVIPMVCGICTHVLLLGALVASFILMPNVDCGRSDLFVAYVGKWSQYTLLLYLSQTQAKKKKNKQTNKQTNNNAKVHHLLAMAL